MTFPRATGIASLGRAQMVEVDRLMIEEYGITLVQMMENAGRALALVARRRFLKDRLSNSRVLVMAGPGGNGGGAMVAVRRLACWGAYPHLVLSRPADRLRPVPAHQLAILERMGVPRILPEQVENSNWDLIVDGLIGYSLSGSPRGTVADLIGRASDSAAPILALDTPSGLDVDTGKPFEPVIRATATLTLALPKTGLLAESAAEWVGELYCADLSVPPEIYRKLGINPGFSDVFAQSDIVRLT